MSIQKIVLLILTASISYINAMEPSPGSVSPALQSKFINLGTYALTKIYSNEPWDISKETAFEDLQHDFNADFGNAAYSSLSAYSPSNFLRKYWASTDQEYIHKRKNHLVYIISILWKLDDMNGTDKFQRGSFTLIDPNHKLSDFIHDYIKLVTGYEDPKAIPFLTTTCNFAYRREPTLGGSSHHVKHCPDSQFGIDVRFDPEGGILKLLPYECTHLLFAPLTLGNQNKPLTFLKWEEVGMGSIGAMAFHGLNFAHSQSHVNSNARREKDIHPDILEALNKGNIISENKKAPKTIWEIYELCQNIIQSKEDETAESAKTILAKVKEIYPEDFNHIRCGNEIIVDMSQFQNN